MAGINPAGWNESDSKDNTIATATRAAVASKSHIVFAVSASFSATTSAVLLQIKDDTTVIWEDYVYDSQPFLFPRGLKIAEGNACSAVLAASGTPAVLGKVNLHGASI